ncbi:ribosomal RNA large subunit methyltransferase E [Striga asiatica]|uniref:rRNA methyltransferase 2, mitochondrial n=1 Tax=Striga asiatica TaxID=4170 RepID=A0A5A7PV17_STRAF|nr:ribosomal RNA large subunit methyltransferase E [Striga asiatica]
MSGTPDFFYREAQRLGYVARSAFKLSQMQKQYKIITPGSSVLDLGCAPGAWLQVACQNLGPLEKGGVVVGVDVKKVKVPSKYCDARVKTVCADVLKLTRDHVRALSPQEKGFSVILSDMCPLVSGITSRDAALSAQLGMRALDLAVGRAAVALDCIDTNNSINNLLSSVEVQSDSSCSASNANGVLRPGGHLLIKLLESEDIKEFGQICKKLFNKASWLRPKATRSCSREIYLICQGLK